MAAAVPRSRHVGKPGHPPPTPQLAMRASRLLPLVLAPLALSTAALAQSSVHVVDAAGGPGSDFVSLQDAMSFAQDGDLILLRDGTYDGATTQDKGLTIAAAPGASPSIRGQGYGYSGLTFWGIPAHSSVQLRGLRIQGSPGLHVWHAEGPAFVDDCEIVGECMFGGTDSAALRVTHSEVLVVASELRGQSSCANHPAGLVVRDGAAHVFDSTLDGTGFGANALELFGASFAYVGGSQLIAGDGADAYGVGLACSKGTDGGAAAYLLDTNSGSPSLLVRDTGLFPGEAGAATPNCPGGLPGVPIEVHGAGSYAPLAGASHGLQVDSPVVDGAQLALRLEGEPGDLAAVAYSTELSPTYAVDFGATAAPSGSALLLAFVGVIDADGELELNPSVELPIGLPALRLCAQGVLVGPNRATLSAPREVLVLAAGL